MFSAKCNPKKSELPTQETVHYCNKHAIMLVVLKSSQQHNRYFNASVTWVTCVGCWLHFNNNAYNIPQILPTTTNEEKNTTQKV